jgi:hypothetical protein
VSGRSSAIDNVSVGHESSEERNIPLGKRRREEGEEEDGQRQSQEEEDGHELKRAKTLVGEDKAAEWTAVLQRLIKGKAETNREVSVIRADQRLIW